MNFKDDEEAFNLLNHLMEKFQQMDLKQHGCNFNFVYVASGATHIENQNIISPHKPFSKGEGGVETESIRYPFAPNKDGGKEERFRHCITLLMAEHYGDEPLFCLQAHWQAVYRILVDKGYCRDSDFDGFDVFIQRVMPEEVNKPYKKESVKQISKTDFVLPFKRWRYDPQTSTTRKPFDRMVAVAQRFMAILEENGL